jgi:hypothetical protein
MAFSTKAFDLFYKRLGPTGSNNGINIWEGYLPQDWLDVDSGTTLKVSSSFLNFPDDDVTYTYVTTRNSASNATYRALPWGSHACDFLWNATVPSWSYADSDWLPGTVRGYKTRSWQVSLLSSQSFHKNYRSSTFGVDKYSITSSWRVYDGKFSSTSVSHFNYVISESALSPLGNPPYVSTFPTFIGSSVLSGQTDQSNYIAYDVTYPNISGNATSSDGQYFDQGGGVGITRASIQASLTTASVSSSNDTATGLRQLTEALKSRRLFFPTPYSGSGTSGGTDYWLKAYTGYKADEIFNENGGIYNVQLTLKKDVTADYYPDSNTLMTAFIHNIVPAIPSASARLSGADGWYPPDNNIVVIGNGYGSSPVMTFYDVQTGYFVEKFNFNVIQYGYPAQFCLEASGSLTDSASFGIIVDDLQICKVGVTTDSRFIKPTTIGTIISQGAGSTNTAQAEGPQP